jgi:hypothetical protein
VHPHAHHTHHRLRFRLQRLAVWLAAFAVCSGWLSPDAAPGQKPVAREADLKLARLYATAKFVSWPQSAGSAQEARVAASGSKPPFVLGVVAPHPFGTNLAKLDQRKLKDRAIRTVTITSLTDLPACQMLFIPDGADPELVTRLLDAVKNQPVLVWTESGPLRNGVAFAFGREGDSLVIDVDPVELRQRGLSAEAQLLSLDLVRVVRAGP